jgi:Type II CAAX prenyl endopeptidase Rce1-like
MQMLTPRTRDERYLILSSGRLDMNGKAPGQAPLPTPPSPSSSYWSATRRPLPSLSLVAPLMLAYELGILWRSGSTSSSVRTGADAWMRHALAALGLTDQWFPPLLLVVILLGWQVARPRDWRFSPSILVGMVLESCMLAIALVGISRLIDLGFSFLDQHSPPTLALTTSPVRNALAPLIGCLGAGVYEETMFRLILVPILFGLLRLLQTPQILASALAVTGSALLFSLAHHAGTPGEPFTWFAFVFRWMAGVFFAWVFVIRGFGIAVGTHTAYDVMVGWVGWHL